MTWQFTTNVLIEPGDKLGQILIRLKNALVASGRWRVRGSSDNKTFLLDGQTAAVGGSFDMFTANPAWGTAVSPTYPADARPGSISNTYAWLCLEEIASGRILLMQRDYYAIEGLTIGVGYGVATSGATKSQVPALTGSSAFLLGTAWNAQSSSNETSEDSNEIYPASTTQWWMQIAVETDVRAGNVCPWWFSTWSRASNRPMSGGFWESLTDVDTGVTHPFVTNFGRWYYCYGTQGDAASGGVGSSSRWRGGNGLLRCNLGYMHASGLGAIPPAYQQLSSDNKHRTQRPWVLQPTVGSKHFGRLEHFFLNKVPRSYPMTYDIAGASPRLALGHVLVPWIAVVPESSP